MAIVIEDHIMVVGKVEKENTQRVI